MTDTTHHSTLSAEIRTIANSCDIGGMNQDWFLKGTFINDLASYVQRKEESAYKRGMDAGKTAQPLLP